MIYGFNDNKSKHILQREIVYEWEQQYIWETAIMDPMTIRHHIKYYSDGSFDAHYTTWREANINRTFSTIHGEFYDSWFMFLYPQMYDKNQEFTKNKIITNATKQMECRLKDETSDDRIYSFSPRSARIIEKGTTGLKELAVDFLVTGALPAQNVPIVYDVWVRGILVDK